LTHDWIHLAQPVILFVIGVGALAAALLYIRQLYREVVPDGDVQLQADIGAIKRDLHDIRNRVGMLEIEVAKIESKIDRLYEFLIDRFSAEGTGPKRR